MLVRRGALPSNFVRDLTPLELDRDRTARALSLEEVRQRLRVLDADPVAQHHDLPEGHQPTFRGSRLPTPQYEFGDAEQ